jgi:hypothetical protein
MLGYESRIVKPNPAFDDLEKMAKHAPDDPRDRARRVAKALGVGDGLAPQRNARGDQRMTKGANDFHSPQFVTNSDYGTAQMPNPSDVNVLHDDAVNPDLRSALIDARKRKPANAGAIANWERGIAGLREAIDDLIETQGIKFQALHRLLGTRQLDTSGNPAKFAKGDATAERNRALDMVMGLPRSVRRDVIALKVAVDDLSPVQRRAVRNSPRTVGLLDRIEKAHGSTVCEAIELLLT